MKETWRRIWFRWRSAAVLTVAVFASLPATAQDTPAAKKDYIPGNYSIFEVSPYLGGQWFQIYANEKARVNKLNPGFTYGVRFTEDLWNYVGLEQSWGFAFNKLKVMPFGLNQWAEARNRNFSIILNPVLHLTPRQSKFRPFLTAGPGLTWYTPDQGFKSAPAGTAAQFMAMRTKYGPALSYGGGVKYNATPKIGLRVDLRGLWTQGWAYELPNSPMNGTGSLYIPNHGSENAMALTGGVSFRFGDRNDEPPPPPPPPPAPKPTPNVKVGNISGARDVCPGDDVRLRVDATGWLQDQTPVYQWTINGNVVPGANGPTLAVPTLDGSGNKSIAVTVSVPGSSMTSDPVTLRVKNYAAPTVTLPLSSSSVAYGGSVPLAAIVTSSECGGATTVIYSASDGLSVGGGPAGRGGMATGVFDTNSVRFDRANRLKQQTKVIHFTAKATDSKGGSASAGADLTVTLSPEATRLDDLVFPLYSARVNNCAKRVLLEQLTPMLRDDPNAQVILIGHRDEKERGRAASTLDRQRALDAAAVLSAGKGICPALELNRIKLNWVGADQTSQTRPALCGASTDVKERRGSAIREADARAQYRRVEVWIIPGGAQVPSSLSDLKEAPEKDLKRLGCPR